MKRRKSRDINVFNMSMLDVICSALGAFVILILMADFNRSEAVQTIENLQAEIRHHVKSNKKLRREAEERDGTEDENDELKKENKDLKKKIAELEKQATDNEEARKSEKDLKEKLQLCEKNNKELKKSRGGDILKHIRLWGDPRINDRRKKGYVESIEISGRDPIRYRNQDEMGRRFPEPAPCYKYLRNCTPERTKKELCTSPFGSRPEWNK